VGGGGEGEGGLQADQTTPAAGQAQVVPPGDDLWRAARLALIFFPKVVNTVKVSQDAFCHTHTFMNDNMMTSPWVALRT